MKLPTPPLTPDDDFRASVGIVEMLTKVGMCGSMLGAIVDLHLHGNGRPKMPAELARYVTGPIIVHNKVDGGSIYDHPVKTQPAYKEQIHWERAQIGLGVSPFLVSPTEIAMVMFNASLEHPFRDYLAELYLWAGSHAAKLATGGQDQFWNMLNSGKETPPAHRSSIVTDEMVLTQEPWKSELIELSREIRRKVVNHAKGRERARHVEPEEEHLLAAE